MEKSMPTERLTAARVRQVEATGKGRLELWDEHTTGLILRVGKTTKTWYVRYRLHGEQKRMKVGPYPHLSLKEARAAAEKAVTMATEGRDPAAPRAERRRGERTFERMAEEALESLAMKTRERTRVERRRILKKELLPFWGSRDASEITRRDVKKLRDGIHKRGHTTMANRTLSLVKVLYNQAMENGFPGIEANPAARLGSFKEKGRHRYLDREEIGIVWRATEDEWPATRTAFRLALLTAQRIGSVCAMRWDRIIEGADGPEWTIQESAFKGGRPHMVPLSAEAVEVLDQLRELRTTDEPWVFPSRAGSKVPHFSGLSSKALGRVRERSGLPHWTLHDFRTTFRTWATRHPRAGGLGVPPMAADAVLGHKEASLGFSRYTGDGHLYLLEEKREALVKWGSFVADASMDQADP